MIRQSVESEGGQQITRSAVPNAGHAREIVYVFYVVGGLTRGDALRQRSADSGQRLEVDRTCPAKVEPQPQHHPSSDRPTGRRRPRARHRAGHTVRPLRGTGGRLADDGRPERGGPPQPLDHVPRVQPDQEAEDDELPYSAIHAGSSAARVRSC
jgi:hypothetical protein